MTQSRRLYVGWDVHQEAIAVADVAQDHDAEVVSLGTIGTRQCDLDTLMRPLHAKATPLVFVYDAGPCGSWLYRDLTKTGPDGGVVAPSLLPNKAGDRVTTDRRAARHLARRLRAGDLTPVDVPQVDDEAMRERRRARAASIRDRNAAQSRRHAFLLRQDMRSTGQAMGAPHLSAGVRTASVRRQPNRASARKRCGRSANTPHASSVWNKPARSGSKLGASPQEVRPSRRCGGSSAPWRSRPSPPSETSRA